MRTARENVRLALLIVAALLLAMLLGILVTMVNAADGGDMVLWKGHCPAYADVIQEPAADWGGVHVLCVRGALAEETPGGRK